MKPIIPFALLGALFAVGTASAVSTDPVGYITAKINGNVSGSSAGAATFIAPSLVLPAVFTGSATASPSGTNSIGFSGNVPEGLDSSYVIEVKNGASAGWWSAVVSSTPSSITTLDNFPAGLAADVQVTVRKFTTIADVFGQNSPGLTPYSGGADNDEIQILDPVNQSADVIVFADGWFNLVTEAPADDTIIYPGTAVKVIRKAAGDLDFTIVGEVKITPTQVDVFPQDNWLGQPNPTGGSLASMTFATALAASDVLNIINPDAGLGQPTDAFVPFDGVMFNLVTEADASDVSISEGGGYLVRRAVGEAASTITIPAQTIAP